MTAADGLRIREAVRAVVISPDQQVLLVRFEFPTGTRWALPGGGIDTGETPEDALRRELVEEVGYHDAVVGPHLWNRLHIVPFFNGQFDGQRERIHLVEVAAPFEPRPALTGGPFPRSRPATICTSRPVNSPPTCARWWNRGHLQNPSMSLSELRQWRGPRTRRV